jgi:hypothetical protein
MCIGLYMKYPLFLSDINETWIFAANIRNMPKYQNFMKIRQLGAELFHVDRHADGQTLRS